MAKGPKKPAGYKGPPAWNTLSLADKKKIVQQYKSGNNFQQQVASAADAFNQAKQAAGQGATAANKLTQFQYIGVPGGELRGPKGHNRGYLPGSPSKQVPGPAAGTQFATGDPAGWFNPNTTQRPLYVDGDQWKPANGGLSTDEIIDLQRKMDQLGFYPKGAKYTLGQWDQADGAAYEKVLAGANVNMQDASTYLQNLIDHPEQSVDAGGGEQKQHIIKLTNPEEIRSTATAVAKALYGEYLPEATLQSLIESFHNVEMEKQQQMNALDDSGADATVIESPNLDTYIQQQLQQRAPEKTLAHDFGQHMDQALQTLMTTPGGR